MNDTKPKLYIVWQSDGREELLSVEGTLVLKECFVLKEQRYTQLARLHCRLEVNTILVQGAVRSRQYLEVVGQKLGGSGSLCKQAKKKENELFPKTYRQFINICVYFLVCC